MDTQTNTTVTIADIAYCACCTPRQLLVPRDDVAGPERWAVCPGRGAWYARRDDGAWQPSPPPDAARPAPQGRAAGQWAGGDALPAIVPGVRIDLSKESYA